MRCRESSRGRENLIVRNNWLCARGTIDRFRDYLQLCSYFYSRRRRDERYQNYCFKELHVCSTRKLLMKKSEIWNRLLTRSRFFNRTGVDTSKITGQTFWARCPWTVHGIGLCTFMFWSCSCFTWTDAHWIAAQTFRMFVLTKTILYRSGCLSIWMHGSFQLPRSRQKPTYHNRWAYYLKQTLRYFPLMHEETDLFSVLEWHTSFLSIIREASQLEDFHVRTRCKAVRRYNS
jgi:hypothetical protein